MASGNTIYMVVINFLAIIALVLLQHFCYNIGWLASLALAFGASVTWNLLFLILNPKAR